MKAIISYVLCAMTFSAAVSEGINDSDSLTGALFLTSIAILLSILGLNDVNKKRSTGRGMAIGAIVCSVVILLMLIGIYSTELEQL